MSIFLPFLAAVSPRGSQSRFFEETHLKWLSDLYIGLQSLKRGRKDSSDINLIVMTNLNATGVNQEVREVCFPSPTYRF